MNNINKTRIILIGALLLLAGLTLVEVKTQFVRRWIADVVYDNRAPQINCEALPGQDDIEAIMETHQNIIKQIEDINPGHIRVYMDSSDTCPEKYLLVIEYPSHANREQIEALIGDTFFGVPWEGRNV